MLFDSLLPLILRDVTSLDFFHFIWYRRSTFLPFPLTKLLSLNDVFPSRVRASLRKRCYCDAHRRKFQVLAKHVLKTFMLTLGGVIFWVVSMRASSVLSSGFCILLTFFFSSPSSPKDNKNVVHCEDTLYLPKVLRYYLSVCNKV